VNAIEDEGGTRRRQGKKEAKGDGESGGREVRRGGMERSGR